MPTGTVEKKLLELENRYWQAIKVAPRHAEDLFRGGRADLLQELFRPERQMLAAL